MADEIAQYTGQNYVQDFDGYFDKVKRYPTPAGAQRGYIPMTDGNGQMILHSMTDPGSESEANANIAPLEDGPTASQAYAVGDLMIYQGQLMTVVQAIEQGGNIVPGTNVVSYTVAQALMQKVPVYGMGKNLLRNAYFVGGGSQQGGGQFPINQRAGYVVPPNRIYYVPGGEAVGTTDAYYSITSISGNAAYFTKSGTQYVTDISLCVPGYTGSGYGIDGWLLNDPNGSLVINPDSIKISLKTQYAGFIRKFSEQELTEGWTYTLSILTANGCFWYTFQLSKAGNSLLPAGWYGVDDLYSHVGFYNGEWWVYLVDTSVNESREVALRAAKLELGTQQTLAHQDESGNWVLNEVPDYETELLRCQTSKADAGDSYANKTLATQQQLATVEPTSTASRAYAAGEYLCYGGLLYRVTAAIATGGTISPGTNIVLSTVGQQLARNLGGLYASDTKSTGTDSTVTFHCGINYGWVVILAEVNYKVGAAICAFHSGSLGEVTNLGSVTMSVDYDASTKVITVELTPWSTCTAMSNGPIV